MLHIQILKIYQVTVFLSYEECAVNITFHFCVLCHNLDKTKKRQLDKIFIFKIRMLLTHNKNSNINKIIKILSKNGIKKSKKYYENLFYKTLKHLFFKMLNQDLFHKTCFLIYYCNDCKSCFVNHSSILIQSKNALKIHLIS